MSSFGSSFWNNVLVIAYIRLWWSYKPVSKVVHNLNDYLRWAISLKASVTLENLTWLGCLVSNWTLPAVLYYHTAWNKHPVNQLKFQKVLIVSLWWWLTYTNKEPRFLSQIYLKRCSLNIKWYFVGLEFCTE